MKDIIHFSHANGFPAGSYRTLFSFLESDFEIGFIDRLGHAADYPVTDNWHHLERELIDHLQRRYQQPVYVVGHSLGGLLSLMVAAKRPDLVKGLVMLDAPFLTPFEARGVRLLKRLGLIDRVTPAGRTVGRKESWPSTAEALEYFNHKRLFKRFDERCLQDYIHYGTRQTDECLRQLHFDAETEVRIYRTIPDDLYRLDGLGMPAAVLAGRRSDVFKPHHAKHMRRRLNMSVSWLNGGHMFPLERPEQTAQLIRQQIQSWAA